MINKEKEYEKLYDAEMKEVNDGIERDNKRFIIFAIVFFGAYISYIIWLCVR